MEIAILVVLSLVFVGLGILSGYFLNVLPMTAISLLSPLVTFLLYNALHRPMSQEQAVAIVFMAIIAAWATILLIVPMWITAVVVRRKGVLVTMERRYGWNRFKALILRPR